MHASVRELLAGIIDYAGLFPPAALPMDAALREYLRASGSPEAWMLGRFICPAARLSELSACLRSEPGAGGLRLSLLGRGGEDDAAFLNGLSRDLDAAIAFLHEHAEVTIDALETRWPTDLVRSRDAALTHTLAGAAGDRIAAALDSFPKRAGEPRVALRALAPFFEVAVDAGADAFEECVQGLADHNAGCAIVRRLRAGRVKIRTGGVQAAMFPSSGQVAAALHAAARHGVALKATAGLHHPFRHYNDGVAAKMHGFINVFGGAALLDAAARSESPMSDRELCELLSDESPADFTFGGDGLEWRERRASPGQIRATRTTLALSFGSCSFAEPVEDLTRLGLI